jgi:hypothetical protein
MCSTVRTGKDAHSERLQLKKEMPIMLHDAYEDMCGFLCEDEYDDN